MRMQGVLFETLTRTAAPPRCPLKPSNRDFAPPPPQLLHSSSTASPQLCRADQHEQPLSGVVFVGATETSITARTRTVSSGSRPQLVALPALATKLRSVSSSRQGKS